jgi:hypothetical protein
LRAVPSALIADCARVSVGWSVLIEQPLSRRGILAADTFVLLSRGNSPEAT